MEEEEEEKLSKPVKTRQRSYSAPYGGAPSLDGEDDEEGEKVNKRSDNPVGSSGESNNKSESEDNDIEDEIGGDDSKMKEEEEEEQEKN